MVRPYNWRLKPHGKIAYIYHLLHLAVTLPAGFCPSRRIPAYPIVFCWHATIAYLPYYFAALWRRYGAPGFKGFGGGFNYGVIIISGSKFYGGYLFTINRR
jgi:hypothetical protein